VYFFRTAASHISRAALAVFFMANQARLDRFG
jgi:hypothetical protein